MQKMRSSDHKVRLETGLARVSDRMPFFQGHPESKAGSELFQGLWT